MKSLKDYSVNITEEAYHAYPAWSYSKIARYAKEGFSAIATIHDSITPTSAMAFGSLFDAIITHDNVDDEYVVSDTCPPPAEKGVLDYLLSVTDVPFYEIDSDVMMNAIEFCGYQRKWSYAAQYKHIEENKDYYELRRTGKKVVSQADYNDAMKMAKALHEDELAGKLFQRGVKDNVEYLYQTKYIIKATFADKNVELKIMPDLIIIDHNAKTIQLVDLKTSSAPAFEFSDNFVKLRYDIQASLYSDVISYIKKRDEELKDYTMLPYIFTDISRSDMVPVSYVYDQSSVDGLSFKDYQYKNYRDLLTEIIKYEESNAVVPSYIQLGKLNNIVDILNNK